MDTIFFTKVLISILLGGVWVVLVTYLGEKYGSKIGGLITGLPSTAIFGLIFLALTNSPSFAAASTTIMPAGIGIENFYIVLFILLLRYGLWVSLAMSLVFWFAGSYFLVTNWSNSYWVSWVFYLFSLILSIVFIEKVLQIPSSSKKVTKYTKKVVLTRAILGGLMVGAVVVAGRIGGTLLGGMAAVFPALISSTMIITYLSHGRDFAAATMKSVIPGLSGLAVYSFFVRITYVQMGVFVGTLLSVAAAIFWSFLLYKLLVSKTR